MQRLYSVPFWITAQFLMRETCTKFKCLVPGGWYLTVDKLTFMLMLSPLWQKRGFDEKPAVLWRSDHSHTFNSTPIVNYTENRPLSASSRSEWDKIERNQIPCGCSTLSAEVGSAGPGVEGSLHPYRQTSLHTSNEYETPCCTNSENENLNAT